MLKGFSDILKTCFEGATLIGRMGGDEFVVILEGDDVDRADVLTERMQEMMRMRNREEAAFCYGVSYGVAYSGEQHLGRRAHDVYMLADQRMYDMKQQRHAAVTETVTA